METEKHFIFYDGDCPFCNYWVRWLLKRDKSDRFLFASLNSEFAQNFLKERNLKQTEPDTVYLWKPGAFYFVKSQAVFAIAKILGGRYSFFSLLRYLPTFLSDLVYTEVAKRRRRIPVKSCPLPEEKYRHKFL